MRLAAALCLTLCAGCWGNPFSNANESASATIDAEDAGKVGSIPIVLVDPPSADDAASDPPGKLDAAPSPDWHPTPDGGADVTPTPVVDDAALSAPDGGSDSCTTLVTHCGGCNAVSIHPVIEAMGGIACDAAVAQNLTTVCAIYANALASIGACDDAGVATPHDAAPPACVGCNGCCDSTGSCQTPTDTTCGAAGSTCLDCTVSNQVCSAGRCG